jgi:hypothetical protein
MVWGLPTRTHDQKVKAAKRMGNDVNRSLKGKFPDMLGSGVHLTEVFQRLPGHPTLAQAAALTPARLAAEWLAAQAAEVA